MHHQPDQSLLDPLHAVADHHAGLDCLVISTRGILIFLMNVFDTNLVPASLLSPLNTDILAMLES